MDALRTLPLAVLLLLSSGPAAARPDAAGEEAHPPAGERPKTCLVLGGGGARGAAHIGLLRVLERERVPVDCIVGTSMGAIVGGMYAAGYSADEIESILERIDWNDVLLDRTPRRERSVRRKEDDLRRLGGIELGLRDGRIALPQGVIQGQRLELLLRRLLLPASQVEHFDQLPIPFRAVAADVVTGEKVVFARGELAMAIRASMSVPGIFAPVRIDGHLLVDGGVLDNVPIDEARRLGAQRLIVSRVGSPLMDEEQLDSPLAISQQTTRMLMKRIVDAQIATLGPDDLLITPELGHLGAQEFNRAAEASARGLAAAEAAVAGIRRYSVDERSYAAFRGRHRLPRYDAPQVAFIDVARDRTRTADYVERKLEDMRGRPLDPGLLEQRIAEVYGEGRYQQLQWREETRDGATGLRIEPEDKRWGPDFLHGTLRLSSNFDGDSDYQLAVELTKTGLNGYGGEARVHLGLGRVDGLAGEFFQPFGPRMAQAAWAWAGYRAFDLPVLDPSTGNHSAARFRHDSLGARVGWRFQPDYRWAFSADIGRHRERTWLLIGDPDEWAAGRAYLGDLMLGLRYDTLDSSAFPTRGQRLSLDHTRYLRALGSDVRADVTRLSWDGVASRGPHHLLAGVALSTASDEGRRILGAHTFLGGLGRLSGYGEDVIFAPQTALLRAVYYHRLGHADGLMKMPLYLGGSLELGGFWQTRDDIDRDGWIGAGSAFLGIGTGLGPILFGYGRAEGGIESFYLLFGSLLQRRDGP